MKIQRGGYGVGLWVAKGDISVSVYYFGLQPLSFDMVAARGSEM